MKYILLNKKTIYPIALNNFVYILHVQDEPGKLHMCYESVLNKR